MSDYEPLLDALRKFKAQSDSGFEGLIRDCLESLSQRTLRLLKSGPQGGKDILSDTDLALPGIAIEAKRFNLRTSLPLDELKSKLREALQSTPDMDIWGLVLSREMKQPDWTELQQIGEAYGVTLLCLDWRAELGSLPAIAIICCAGRHIAEKRLTGDLAPVFDRIESHPDFQWKADDLRRQLTAPETGLDLARQAIQDWLKKVLSSRSTSHQSLGSYAEILSADAHLVSRPTVEGQINEWWNLGSRTPAVLVGNEGRGKTWVALKWCIHAIDQPGPPLAIVTSAKKIPAGDASDILADALSRCFPHVELSALKQRIKRWAQSNSPTRVLLIVDGLNERWSVNWHEFVQLFEVEPWKDRVSLLLTSRSAYWQDDLSPLQGATDEPITEIVVPEFTNSELDVYLETHGLLRTQLPSSLIKLIRIPRFARLAITLKDTLAGVEDLTEARLVLEDWCSRLRERDLRLNDESLLRFVTNLAQDVLQDPAFSISTREIHDRLSADSGRDLGHYWTAINEIVEGLWLSREDRAHRYKINGTLLPYVIGLDLARSIEKMTERAAIDDVIAKYEEQLRGADIGVAILRTAASTSFARQKATNVALEALLNAWIHSPNFGQVDFDEMWPLISRNPCVFLDVAERVFKDSPVARGEGEILVKGLANADKWPAVHTELMKRFPRWVGSYELNPKTQDNLAAWGLAETFYSRNISRYFRPDEKDWLSYAAFAIISDLKRGPFIETLVTWAVTRALMTTLIGIEQFEWLLRLNTEDYDTTEDEILKEAAALQALTTPVAAHAADILLDTLATPRALAKKVSKKVTEVGR